jgi:hypothetical protein
MATGESDRVAASSWLVCFHSTGGGSSFVERLSPSKEAGVCRAFLVAIPTVILVLSTITPPGVLKRKYGTRAVDDYEFGRVP